MIERTCPGGQIGDITDQVVGHRVDHKRILNAGHQIAHEYSLHSVLIEKYAGHVVAIRNVLRPHVLRILERPPSYHVGLDSAFRPWPFKRHIRRVNDWSDIDHRIWTCKKLQVFRNL